MRSSAVAPNAQPAPGRHGRPRARGQALAEFALVLVPLTLVLLGIIQLGLIFNAYVTVSNAAREGARTASIYVYNYTCTPTPAAVKGCNDTKRALDAQNAVSSTLGLLSTVAPQFTKASDVTIAYSGTAGCPAAVAGVALSDSRKGEYACLTVQYHLDLLIPLIGELMPKDSGGRMIIQAQSSMVIN